MISYLGQRLRNLTTKTAKDSVQRRRLNGVTHSDHDRLLPIGVQKSYFMLSDAERTVLNTALEKYQPGQSEPIFVGDEKALKLALRLMTWHRLKIDEVLDGRAVTSYTRWADAVEVMGNETQEVYLTFSPRFERIWLECKKRLRDYHSQKPAAIRLRSKYAIRLYVWAKEYASAGSKRITLEELRAVLGLDSVKGPRWECYPGSAPGGLGELPPASVESRHRADQQEDRLEHQARIAGAARTWPGSCVDF